MNSYKKLLLSMAAVVGLSGLSSLPALAETINIGRVGDSTTFDPIKTSQNVDIWIYSAVHAALVRANREGTEVIPDLAESWTVSEDKMTFVFTLRDAKFSDGATVKASDVVFSLTRLRDDPESAMSWLAGGMKTMSVVDDKTVKIELSQPEAAFVPTLGLLAAAIIPEKNVTADGADYGNNPVGAGRWRLKSWNRGQSLTLEPNPHYYGGAPTNADEVVYHVVPDENTRVLKVQAGELDVAEGVPFALLPGLSKDSNIQVHLDPSTREDHLLINHKNEWLAKKEVRQAINMAINMDAIVKIVTFGYGTVANNPIPMGTPFYNGDLKNHPYDPAKAKEMIEKAGATGVELEFLVGAGSALREQTGVIVQQQLAAIGLKVKIKKIDSGQVWSTFKSGGYDLAPALWTYDVLDPDHKLAFSLDGGKNRSYYTNYHNPEVTKLLDAARVELDLKKRQGIYDELLTIAKQDVHWIDLYYSPFSNISRKGVSGYYQSPMGVVPLHEIKK